MGGFGMLDVPATRDLLAKVAALPPATDEPAIDEAAARPPIRSSASGGCWHRCGGLRPRRRADRRWTPSLQLLLPALVRTGIDRGVPQHRSRCCSRSSAVALGVLLPDWAVSGSGQRLTGRTGERLLYTLRVKTFAHLQRLGLDYYERELAGRIMTRMTTDVDALSTFLQTGLATASISLLTLRRRAHRAAVARRPAGADRWWRCCRSDRGDLGLPAASGPGLRRGPGTGQHRQRPVPGERGRSSGRAGFQPREAQRRRRSSARPATTASPGCAPSATSRRTSRSSSCCPTWPARPCWSSAPIRLAHGSALAPAR